MNGLMLVLNIHRFDAVSSDLYGGFQWRVASSSRQLLDLDFLS